VAKNKKMADSAFLLFDVIYEDGTRSSNRRILSADIDPLERERSVRALIEQQDLKIAEASGRTRGPIKSVMPCAD
jgi:hypothetical protein